ncbi:MarR family transcriptional regulator [Lachnospiraceae bacterium JLR.KK008]
MKEDICICIKRIHNQLERGKNRNLKVHGLTGTQLDILEYLYYGDGKRCTLAGIAAFFDVKHTSVLHVVKILEKKELVVREEKRPGSRAGQIFLTGKGREIMQEIDAKKSLVQKIMIQGITETEQEVLCGLLQRVYHNLKQAEQNLKQTESGSPEHSLPTGEEKEDERQDNGNF